MPGRSDWTPERIRRDVEHYRTMPRTHPERVDEAGPGQESVWDYPRPPRIEPESRLVRVVLGGVEVARSERACRVLETSSPPCVYVPREEVRTEGFVRSGGQTLCEWKGLATYWEADSRGSLPIAWSYEDPFPSYEVLRGWLAFFPGRVDGCWLDDELVRAQPGEFYGGWITDDVVGPFKGVAGSEGW